MEEKGIVKYESRDGQELSLSFDTVRKYLVSGKRELVTEQEIMYFMGVCKSRGLNPFKKDCYLIKYSETEPAAIVTSIDFFRSRARSKSDCTGWNSGIIVMRKGVVVYSDGLFLEGDRLLGGWFKAIPEGWKTSFTKEVNLKGYIKKKRDGSVTKFWSEDNQPSQIDKVAESQGLRSLWPDEFQGMYTDVEMREEQVFDIIPEQEITTQTEEEPSLIPDADQKKLNEFILITSEKAGKSIGEVKIQASKRLKEFKKSFEKWLKAETSPDDQGSPKKDEPRKELPSMGEPLDMSKEKDVGSQDQENEEEESKKSEEKEADKIIKKFIKKSPDKLKEWAALVGNSFLKEMPEKAQKAFDKKWDKFFGPQEEITGFPKGTGETLNDGTPEVLNMDELSRELTPDFDFYSMHLQREVVDEWLGEVIKRKFGKDRDDVLANFSPGSVYKNFKGWLVPSEEREGKEE